MYKWFCRIVLVVLLGVVAYGIMYAPRDEKGADVDIPPSKGVHLTHQQYTMMEHRMQDMEALLKKNGLAIPANRPADFAPTGPSTR